MLRQAARLILRKIVRPQQPFHEWSESFPTWSAATMNADGYSEPLLLEKLFQAALLQKSGQAVYERDGILFDTIQHNWPLLTCLQDIAMQKNDTALNVVDLGGALGSSFRAIKSFIPSSVEINWAIVEQPGLVELGRAHFTTPGLKFYDCLSTAITEMQPDVLLFSGVLQYLPNPFATIESVCQSGIGQIIIDRTTVITEPVHRIVVQKVPPHMYKASYPCWLFNEPTFLASFQGTYQLVAGFDSCFDPPLSYTKEGTKLCYKGFYFRAHD